MTHDPLEGTTLPLDLPPDQLEEDDTDSSIVNPFDPEDIDVVTRTPNVNLLLSRLATERLELEPDFQRKAGIWNQRRKSRLIESLLLKIPLPTMYAAESLDRDDRWTVVDGVQRISTIASFVRPGLLPDSPFTMLSDLEYLTEYNGSSFEDLSPRLQTRIEETEFVLNLIRRGTPEPVMFNIFARINTGGAPLTRQELRHALTPGAGRVLLKTLAGSDEFRSATGGRVSDDRMEAREMILRYIAFHLLGVNSYDKSTDFDTFLTLALKRLSEVNARKRDTIERTLKRSLVLAHAVFGQHAFRKSLPDADRRAPINKALFETVLVAISGLTQKEQHALPARSAEILERFADLFADDELLAAISQGTGDVRKVQLRHARIQAAFA